MEPLVSVIVPVYKVEPFLQKCADSIIDQTYHNLEIILVDDGSPDHCGEICDKLAQQDERIQVIHQENQGLAAARNKGIDSCKGEYILFVDSDDYLELNAIECLLHASMETNADVVCCGHFEENGVSSVRHPLTESREIFEGEAILKADLSDAFAPFAWNKLWKREQFAKVRFPAGRYFEDLSTNWKIFDQCHLVVCVPDVLFHYLVRKNSISNTKNMKNLADHWLAFKERYDALVSKNEDLRQICLKGCFETIAYTWRWLHGTAKKDRILYSRELQDMQSFLKEHKSSVSICSFTTRFALFCALHSNPVTIIGCYYLNRIYRKSRGMDQKV